MIDNVWDVRCPPELKLMFKERRGFWFKVNKERAKMIVAILSKCYGIREPNVEVDVAYLRKSNVNATYENDPETIVMYSMNHAKSIFHEWYHHLDKVTNGKYDSDDNCGGDTSNGWIFADKLWEKVRCG